MKLTSLFSVLLFGVLATVVGAKDAHQTVCNPPEVECRAAEPTAAVEAHKENLWVSGNWAIKRSNAPDVQARKENLWGSNWVIKRSNAPGFLQARAAENSG